VIFSAVKCVSPIVHRDLTDMCCAAKDMQVVPGIENVSKTKIRGLFALLKACQGLGIMSEEGESVQLRLGDGINSFKDLKQRHDIFVNQILNHLRVVLPQEVKAQLLWNWNDPEYVARKVLEMKQLEEIVEDFFLHRKPVTSSTNSNALWTISSPHDEEEDDYNFEDSFVPTFSFQEDFQVQKPQMQQFPRSGTDSLIHTQQVFGNQRNERNSGSLNHSSGSTFDHSGNNRSRSNFEREQWKQPSFPGRGPLQEESSFQLNSFDRQPNPRNYQLVNNSGNNKQPFNRNSTSFRGPSSSSQQLSSYFSESQQILRSHQQVSRSNNSDNISNNLAFHIKNSRNNNSSNSDIPSYQYSSRMMNSYNANKNW
jgi:hypothetical protein